MKIEVTMACNVRCYHKLVVEAETLEDAIAQAKALEGQCEWDTYEYGEEADALEPTYWASECDENGDVDENGDTCDEQDDPSYVYRTELLRFARMLGEADIHAKSLVHPETGALMDVQSIRRTARHILKLDESGA
jgi:hypothetical protein